MNRVSAGWKSRSLATIMKDLPRWTAVEGTAGGRRMGMSNPMSAPAWGWSSGPS
jgi:hypothetical protein